MALVPHKVVALNELNEGEKNTIAGAVVSLYDTDGTAVTLFDDESGSNGSTAKQTDSQGVVVVYVTAGEYDEEVNGSIKRRVNIGGNSVVSYEDTASLQSSRPNKTGQRAENRERANAQYTLMPSGYVALAGDITAANGRVWALQVDVNGMSVLAFGDSYDDAIDDAVSRCANVCDIIVASNSYTDGKTFSGVDGVSIRIADSASLTVNDGADRGALKFISSTNVQISGGAIDGNASNQSSTSFSNDAYGLFFDSCSDVKVYDVDISNTIAGAVRSTSTSNITVDCVTGYGAGYIPIYLGIEGSGGTDIEGVEIKNCNYDWSDSDAATTNVTLCSVTTNDDTKDIRSVSIHHNRFKQSESVGMTASNACIAVRNAVNYNVSDNIVSGGGIPITLVSGSENLICNGNVIEGDILEYGIEIAGGAENFVVSSNIIRDTSGAATSGIQVNGGSSHGIINGNQIVGAIAGVKIVAPSTSNATVDVSIVDNNINVSNQAYQLKNADGFTISGGIAETSDSTSIIYLEDSTGGLISNLNTRASTSYFIRVTGINVQLEDTLISGNKIHALASNDRYIYDTTGTSIGTNVRYVANLNGSDT